MKIKDNLRKLAENLKTSQKNQPVVKWILISFVGLGLGVLCYFILKNYMYAAIVSGLFFLLTISFSIYQKKKGNKGKLQKGSSKEMLDFFNRLKSFLLAGTSFKESFLASAEGMKGGGMKDQLLESNLSGLKDGTISIEGLTELAEMMESQLTNTKESKSLNEQIVKRLGKIGIAEDNSAENVSLGIEILFMALLVYFLFLSVGAL
jgi:hypothetical protein